GERQVTEDRALVLEVEGHGRESLESSLDVSRTVGWFTSLFPVAFDLGPLDLGDALAGGSAIGHALKQVKEQLRAGPGRGLGYGVLRYLHAEAGAGLACWPAGQGGFNYLGRVPVGEAQDWKLAPEAVHVPGEAAMPLAHLLDVNAVTLDGPQGPQLAAEWSWARRHLGEAEVRALAEAWQRALAALMSHVAVGGGGHPQSDFPL